MPENHTSSILKRDFSVRSVLYILCSSVNKIQRGVLNSSGKMFFAFMEQPYSHPKMWKIITFPF